MLVAVLVVFVVVVVLRGFCGGGGGENGYSCKCGFMISGVVGSGRSMSIGLKGKLSEIIVSGMTCF